MRKYLLIIVTLGILCNVGLAQTATYKKIRVDISVGFVSVPAYSPTNTKGYTSPGGAYGFEARYNLSDKVGIGVKYFAAAVLSTSGDKFMRSYLANTTYYFSNGRVRFFTGGGLGLATKVLNKFNFNGTVTPGKTGLFIALMPRIGLQAGRFVGDIYFHINNATPSFFIGTSVGFFLGGGKTIKVS